MPDRIIFGSCNSQHYLEQPFWDVISKRNPTAFVWAGDAVYGDDRKQINSNKIMDATPDYLHQLYKEQREVPGYQNLLNKISIFGTIDDHDYGTNNGDKTFRWKKENGMEFVKFLGLTEETSAMARRAHKGAGVYGVHVYDFASEKNHLLSDEDAGLDPDVVSQEDYEHHYKGQIKTESNKLVAVFVLDVRSNKTPWSKKMSQRFSKYPHGDFLGEEQWKWFHTAIGRSTAAVNIIVTGLQVHAPWFYDGNLIENWSAFPKSQHLLYQAILQPNVRAPLLITGDVHLAQILRKDCKTGGDDGIIRPLYEITTSGMTHSWGATTSGTCGRPNLSPLCYFYPYNALFGLVLTYAHWICPWTSLLVDDESNMPKFSLARNVAEVEFDWFRYHVTVRILGVEGQVLLKQDWSMDELSGKDASTKTLLDPRSFDVAREQYESVVQTTESHDFICVNYRGNPDKLQFAFSIVTVVFLFMMLALYPIMMCGGFGVTLYRKRRRNRPKQD
jgi:alkaline phosphatase D